MKRFLLLTALLCAAFGMSAQSAEGGESEKQFVEVYAYYPDAMACFKWSVYINPEEYDEFMASYVLDSIDILDPNTTIDGHLDNFVNEITVNAPDGVEYFGEMIGGGYWMYNLNDEMAQLGVNTQPVVAGDVIFWEYKTDWTSWGVTTVDEMFAVDDLFFVDFGAVNTPAGQTFDTTIVACDSINWRDEWYRESGNYSVTVGANTYNLHLTVNHSVGVDIYETACESFTWESTVYRNSGTYVFRGEAASGCDSIVTLHLTINKPQQIEITESACDSYEWNGQTYTQSGDYTFSGTTVAGCDSIATLHLTINHSINEEISETHEGSYEWNGQTYTESGDYTFNGTTAAGCDSTITLHLTINPISAIHNTVLSSHIYPNPTTEILHIEAAEASTVEIFDNTGRLVMKMPYEESVMVGELSNGIYLLRVSTADGQSATEHFIKQ